MFLHRRKIISNYVLFRNEQTRTWTNCSRNEFHSFLFSKDMESIKEKEWQGNGGKDSKEKEKWRSKIMTETKRGFDEKKERKKNW